MSTTPANPKTEAIRQSVRKSYADLNQLIDGPLARLDASKLYQAPAENEWTIIQNLAHIVEFMPYWAGEIEKLVAIPGQNFGRTGQDERRLAAIYEHGTVGLDKFKAALPASYARLDEVWGTLGVGVLGLIGQLSGTGWKRWIGFIGR